MGKSKRHQKHHMQKNTKKNVPPKGDKKETEVDQVQNIANNVWLKDENASAANVLFPDAADKLSNEDVDPDYQTALLLSLATAEEEGYKSPTKSEVKEVKPEGYKVIDDDGDDIWEKGRGSFSLKTEDEKLTSSSVDKIQRKKNLSRETLGDFNKRLLINPGSSKLKEDEEQRKKEKKTTTVDDDEDFSFVKPFLAVKKKKGLQVIEEEDSVSTEDEKTSLKGDVKKVSFSDKKPIGHQNIPEVKVSEDVIENPAVPIPKDLEEKVVEEILVPEGVESEGKNLEIKNHELEDEKVQDPIPEETVQDEILSSEVEIKDEIPALEVEIKDEVSALEVDDKDDIATSEVEMQNEVSTPDEKVPTILPEEKVQEDVSEIEDEIQVENSGLEVGETVSEKKVEAQGEVSASEDTDVDDTSTIQNSEETPVVTDDENSDTDTLKNENVSSLVEENDCSTNSDSNLDDTVPLSDFQEMNETLDEISDYFSTNEPENCEVIDIQIGGITVEDMIRQFANPVSDCFEDKKSEPETVQEEENTLEDEKPEPEENVKEESADPSEDEKVPVTVQRESRIPTRKRPICRDQDAEEEKCYRNNVQQVKNPFGFKNNSKTSTMFPKENQKQSTMFPKDNNRRESRKDSWDSRQNYREPGRERESRGNYRESRQPKEADNREYRGNYRDSRQSRDNDYKEPRESRPSRDNYRDSRQSRDTEPRESRGNYRDSRADRNSDQKVRENQGQYQRQGGDFREPRGNYRDSRGFSRGPRVGWAPSNNRGRQDERTAKSQEEKHDYQSQHVSQTEDSSTSSSDPGEFSKNSQSRNQLQDNRAPYREHGEASSEDYQVAPNVGHKGALMYRHPGEYYTPPATHFYPPHYPPYPPYVPGYHPEPGYLAQGYPYEAQEYPRPPLPQQMDPKSYTRQNFQAKEQGYYPKQSLLGSPPRQQAGYYQRPQNQKYGDRRGERRNSERPGYGDREMMGGCEERPLISPKTLMTTHIEAPPLQIHDREPNNRNNSRVCGGRGRGYSATKTPFPRKHNN